MATDHKAVLGLLEQAKSHFNRIDEAVTKDLNGGKALLVALGAANYESPELLKDLHISKHSDELGLPFFQTVGAAVGIVERNSQLYFALQRLNQTHSDLLRYAGKFRPSNLTTDQTGLRQPTLNVSPEEFLTLKEKWGKEYEVCIELLETLESNPQTPATLVMERVTIGGKRYGELEKLLDGAIAEKVKANKERDRQSWIKQRGMPSHLSYEEGLVWCRKEQKRRSQQEVDFRETYEGLNIVAMNRCHERMLEIGFSDAEMRVGLHGKWPPLDVASDDPRYEKYKEVMEVFEVEQEAIVIALNTEFLAKPTSSSSQSSGVNNEPANGVALQTAVHSEDFRSVNWFGTVHNFTSLQAVAVKKLWEAWEQGGLSLAEATILDDDTTSNSAPRMTMVFRNNPALNTMIVNGGTKGTWKLQKPVSDDKAGSPSKQINSPTRVAKPAKKRIKKPSKGRK